MKPNMSTVLNTVINDDGVINVTVGHMAYYQLARTSVALIRELSPDGYKAYKAAKYPEGEATNETRAAAYKLAIELAAALPLYERALTDDTPKA